MAEKIDAAVLDYCLEAGGDLLMVGHAHGIGAFSDAYHLFRDGNLVFVYHLVVHLEGQPVRPAPGSVCTLMVRPEAVRTGADPADVNAIPCVVRDSVFLGETTGLTLDASGFTLHASESAAPERRPGDEILCAVPPEAIAILPPDLHDVNVEENAR